MASASMVYKVMPMLDCLLSCGSFVDLGISTWNLTLNSMMGNSCLYDCFGRVQDFSAMSLDWDSPNSDPDEETAEVQEILVFPRPLQSRCRQYGAHGCEQNGSFSYSSWPEFCRCPSHLLCLHHSSGVCTQCRGSFITWRRALGIQADMTILGLIFAPRSLSFFLHVHANEQRLFPIPIGEHEFIDALPAVALREWGFPSGQGSQRSNIAVFVQMLVPHIYLTAALLPNARDSFWWIVALVFGVLSQLKQEIEFIHRFTRTSVSFKDELSVIICDTCSALCAFCLVFVAHAMLEEKASDLVSVGINAVLIILAHRAATKPLLEFREGRCCSALWHICFLVNLLSLSDNLPRDFLTLALVVGPGASLTATVYSYLGIGRSSNRRRSTVIVIHREKFIETSVRQLAKLTPDKLLAPPTVVFIASRSKAVIEAGVDFGGLRRDWLGRLTCELFDTTAGLMDHVVLDGTHFARLRPGANLKHLEALGKAMGLAMRENQPLGIDFCAPQAHMLAHPQLLDSLDRIEQCAPLAIQSGRCARRKSYRGMTELRKLGFSRDWLRWVSREEHDFWNDVIQDPVSLHEQAVLCLNIDHASTSDLIRTAAIQHMRQRALHALVLDIKEEAKALWRGLHAVPNLRLPSLSEETRGSKRRRDELDTLDDDLLKPDRTTKRVCKGDANEFISSCVVSSNSEADGEALNRGGDTIRRSVEESSAGKRRRLAASALQGMLAGTMVVSPAHWKTFTVYAPVSRVKSQKGRTTITWFWKYVENLQSAERANLLEWITSYRRMPLSGFPPPNRHMIIYLTDQSSQHLPCAHTCALQIDLPQNYESEEVFRERLVAATACREFHMK